METEAGAVEIKGREDPMGGLGVGLATGPMDWERLRVPREEQHTSCVNLLERGKHAHCCSALLYRNRKRILEAGEISI